MGNGRRKMKSQQKGFRSVFRVFKAEIVKQQRHNYHSYFVYFSLLVWPILGFLEVYYTYRPFSREGIYSGMGSGRELLTFLATGYMAYTCFWSMVQNAWSMANQERSGGTLEVAFLSPASRLAMSYGKALGALLQETWMFLCFCLFVLLYAGTLRPDSLILLPVTLLLLLSASTVWGGMLNAVFLFSRDASIVMDILDAPMVLFSGMRIPVSCFPVWARLLSLAFPLTYCLGLIRFVLQISGQDGSWRGSLLGLGLCVPAMIAATVLLLHKAEWHNRKYGELQFF